MERFVLVLSLAGWMGILCAPGVSRADPRGEAERFALAGEALFDAKKYREALEQFEQAYERFDPPRFVIPEVIWNLGRCHEELGEEEEALRYFREFVSVASDARYRAVGEKKIKQLEAKRQALVTLNVEPRGASVYLDGRLVGQAPIRKPIPLAPGTHRVTVSLAGYRDLSKEFEVEPKARHELRLDLVRPRGVLRVERTGGPAFGTVRVFVDNVRVYEGHLPAEIEVPAGERRVQVFTPEGVEPVDRVVQVLDREETEVAVRFPPREEAQPAASRKTTEGSQPISRAATAAEVRASSAFPWHFVVIGSGAALLVGGGVLTALAAKDRAKISNAEESNGVTWGISQRDAAAAASSARTKDKASYALYGVGAACVATGVVLWILQSREDQHSLYTGPAIATSASRDGFGVHATWSF